MAKVTVAQCLEKIEALEARIAKLEGRKAPRPAINFDAAAFTGSYADAAAFAKANLERKPQLRRNGDAFCVFVS